MEMTFYIPPVFLFGNKVRPNQEENEAEYKTAMETEIQIENRNIKRIAELKKENIKLKGESEELKIWLRKKLPLALLKEYMCKFEGVDLGNE